MHLERAAAEDFTLESCVSVTINFRSTEIKTPGTVCHPVLNEGRCDSKVLMRQRHGNTSPHGYSGQDPIPSCPLQVPWREWREASGGNLAGAMRMLAAVGKAQKTMKSYTVNYTLSHCLLNK